MGLFGLKHVQMAVCCCGCWWWWFREEGDWGYLDGGILRWLFVVVVHSYCKGGGFKLTLKNFFFIERSIKMVLNIQSTFVANDRSGYKPFHTILIWLFIRVLRPY